MTTVIDVQLSFELERDGLEALHGTLAGADNNLVLQVDDAGVFAGRDDAPAINAVAAALAERGISVRIEEKGRHLVSIGAVRAPWWQRRFTGSRHIRVSSLRGAWTSARARATGPEAVLPTVAMLPPPTMWPPAPTLLRRPRSRPTTTHDPARGGGARLVLTKEQYWPGEQQRVFWLFDGMTIGSSPGCDVRLPDLEPMHAVVRHDDQDEWVVRALAGVTRVHGVAVVSQILRTGARVDIGPHTLGYFRVEHADHGRPYGGRIGGELGHQRPQPPRS